MRAQSTWLSATPAEELTSAGLLLRRWSQADAGPLYRAVSRSQRHLAPWMPWAVHYDRAAAAGFLAGTRSAWEARTNFSWGVWDGGKLVGACGLHTGLGQGVLEIGYWTHVDHTDRGVARLSAAAVTREALALDGVAATQIRHADTNTRSARIPEALGYQRRGTVPRSPDAGGNTDTTVVWLLEREQLDGVAAATLGI